MIEDIETWMQAELSASSDLAALFDAAMAPRRVVRSGQGEEGDSYPAISYNPAGELLRETDRCGGLTRLVLAYEVTVKVESKSFKDSQPYATLIGEILAPKTGQSDDFIWKTTQGALIWRRERGAGGQRYVVQGNLYEFEVSPAE